MEIIICSGVVAQQTNWGNQKKLSTYIIVYLNQLASCGKSGKNSEELCI